MNRLTERKEDRYWIEDEFWVSAKEPTIDKIDVVYRRLAELEDKIESKQVIELPCTVGDIIYWRNGMICGGVVSNIEIEVKEAGIAGYVHVACLDYTETFNIQDINKTWFLSEKDVK